MLDRLRPASLPQHSFRYRTPLSARQDHCHSIGVPGQMAPDVCAVAAEQPISAYVKSGSEIQRAEVTDPSRAVGLPFAPSSDRDAGRSSGVHLRQPQGEPRNAVSVPNGVPERAIGLNNA
jgi:hypothetical protein